MEDSMVGLLMVVVAAVAVDAENASLPERARVLIRANAEHLTRFSCSQAIRRESRRHGDDAFARQPCEEIVAARREGRGPRLRPSSWDRMRLDVILSEGSEVHSWPQGAAVEPGVLQLMTARGSFGTGDFAGFPISILAGAGAEIAFDHNADGVAVYRYRVPRAASRYAVDAAGSTMTTGYAGEFALDTATARLLRLTVITDVLPRESGSCLATTTVEYDPASAALLPRRTRLDTVTAVGHETSNTVEYTGCRAFGAESVIRFDGGDGGAAAVAGKPLAIPAGRTVTLRLVDGIDSATTAAGDRVTATVRSAVKAGREVVVPAGAVAHGRVVHFEQEYMPQRGFWVLVLFDEVEVGGVRHPLRLRPPGGQTQQVGRLPSYPLGTEGPPQVGRFWFAAMDPLVLKRGWESVWETW